MLSGPRGAFPPRSVANDFSWSEHFGFAVSAPLVLGTNAGVLIRAVFHVNCAASV